MVITIRAAARMVDGKVVFRQDTAEFEESAMAVARAWIAEGEPWVEVARDEGIGEMVLARLGSLAAPATRLPEAA